MDQKSEGKKNGHFNPLIQVDYPVFLQRSGPCMAYSLSEQSVDGVALRSHNFP
jgi:hypothetical protein